MTMKLPLLLFFLLLINFTESALQIDPNGYIAFCPCMGRFGNQADQYLGALAFAKRLNRTLILPPWVEYIPFVAGSNQVPFSTYFKPEAMQEYHRVIEMEIFMKELAPKIWPPQKRISFCYSERGEGKGCNAKDGNPFGPFWDNFKVDFISSEIFGPKLHYLNSPSENHLWAEKYPGSKWPVLAFVGAPAGFPLQEENLHLQKYLQWVPEMVEKAKDFIWTLPKGPFIGIHLRNGIDWSRACDLVDGSRELFASPQCTGYGPERIGLTSEMCFPSTGTILKQLKRAIRSIKASSVFVASDKDHMIGELNAGLRNLNVTAWKLGYDSPHVDLIILGRSNLFIGNCVSSYSAFVKRERDVNRFDSQFWGYPPEKKERKNGHDEL